ncbi:Peptidase S10 serine carboxypeptidase [Arabidopsis suecica]|uniref:Carboxypeptidase n=1 Tax=Arabidopsis suecica TaxID=45249 RepID=A0A8T2H3K5_ARASU|nr:Peptidase S10 serine carboxypeptidase [Arabidopsis suecica]
MDHYHTNNIYNLFISFCFTTLLILAPVVLCTRQHRFDSPKRSLLANEQDLVTDLPGQPDVNFRHYAGYVPVDESNGRAMFYWFFEAMDLPKEKPLVLWLNGGPGCSSVGYGATQEIGPFLVDTNGNGLNFNPYAWNKEANMLFLESPVGVGFSYSNTSSDYQKLGDDFTARDAYTFLCNWFEKFPEHKESTFYIAGESYAGKYVPELAEVVYDNNNNNKKNGSSFHINLKGILLGNPETSDAEDWRGWVDYAWSHAVISDETHRIITRTCNFSSENTWSNDECNEAVAEVLKQYHEIDIYSIYTSVCIGDSARSSYFDSAQFKTNSRISSKRMPPRLMGGYDPCLDDYARVFYNRADVQKSLHASDGVNLKNWSICNMEIFNNWTSSNPSVLPIYEKLIAGGLRIWVYSGDTDGRVPVLATRYSLSALELPIKTAWRPWYHEKQVSGWLQEYEGLTFATFRGAGHAVPCFKPSSSLAFFSAFLSGVPPPPSR